MSSPRFEIGDRVTNPSNEQWYVKSNDMGIAFKYNGPNIYIIRDIEKHGMDWYVHIDTIDGQQIVGNKFQYYFKKIEPATPPLDEELFTL